MTENSDYLILEFDLNKMVFSLFYRMKCIFRFYFSLICKKKPDEEVIIYSNFNSC